MSVFYTRGLPKLENGYFYRLYFDMQIDDMKMYNRKCVFGENLKEH